MARNPIAESFLVNEKVDWEYRYKVSIAIIDRETSLANQARLGSKLDQDFVDRFAIAMLDGAVFPALIGYWHKGKIVLIDGNHRLAAAIEAGQTMIDVYIVKTEDSAVIERLTKSANCRTGSKEASPAQVIEHAKWFVKNRGWTIKTAALYFGVREHNLQAALELEEARLRMAQIGVPPTKHSPTMMMRLADIPLNTVMKEVERLVSDAGLITDEVGEIVKKVRQVHSEAEGVALVNEYRQSPVMKERIAHRPPSAGGTRKGHPVTPQAMFLRDVGSLLTRLDKYPTFESLDLTEPTRVTRVSEQCQQLAHRLLKMARSEDARRQANEGHRPESAVAASIK